jgi:phage baseplate assembly protein W
MPKALVIPLELNTDGTFLITTDPVRIMRQRILDILATSRWERVHRVDHGCDLEGFLFTSIIDHLLATKAQEINTILSNSLTYGHIHSVTLTPIRQESGIEAAVMVEVRYQVFEGGGVESASATFDVPSTEGIS